MVYNIMNKQVAFGVVNHGKWQFCIDTSLASMESINLPCIHAVYCQ